MPRFRFERSGDASGRIFDGNFCVAEIADLQLTHALLSAAGSVAFGTEVPLPLFWRQYANHQDPERSAATRTGLTYLKSDPEEIAFLCTGTNASNALESKVVLRVTYDAKKRSYVYSANAHLSVKEGRQWLVSRNPHNGEIEFCNLWPDRTFVVDPNLRKRFSACYVQRGDSIRKIPHHHLESPDKHNIPFQKNDRFMWLLEDENPVFELRSAPEVIAGVCAYMWDGHFGYKVCEELPSVYLPPGTSFEAAYRVYGINRKEGEDIVARAVDPPQAPEAYLPVYVEGVNTFRENVYSTSRRQDEVWPWSTEVGGDNADAVRFAVDNTSGYDDDVSVRIDALQFVQARWTATTLGPAFGQPPFRDGRRYRVSAFVRTDSLAGESRIALRIHRSGFPGLFDVGKYEIFPSTAGCTGTTNWTRLQIVTPSISPPPDRVHILLEQRGAGSTWFDNVFLEEYDEAQT